MSYRYIILFTFMLTVFVVLDLYIWYALRKTTQPKNFQRFKWVIPLTTFLFFFGFVANLYRSSVGIFNANMAINLIVGFSFGVFIAKLIMATPFLLEDLFRLVLWIISQFKSKAHRKKSYTERRRFIRNVSLSLAAVPVIGTIYGITKGKYNYQLKRIPLTSKRLPQAFDGLKIVQFSDFHAGSFDNYEAVREGLAAINARNPDLVLFTGDLVNNHALESEPFLDMLKDIKAPLGKFAILGNHDYGDYVSFDSDEAKEQNMQHLFDNFKKAGFDLLLNENRTIRKGGAQLQIIGVENWGQEPFPQHGDLNRATKGLHPDNFSILLSHDPDHWEYRAREFPFPFDLTLSGHTHGAQFGVDIPGWKWSPVKYRYKRWMGLYHEGDQYLFVSKGFGFLGFPGRVGMMPEIVEFQLMSD
ncbi:MAG: metallophosphoesterase [Bacteroidota bacterium]